MSKTSIAVSRETRDRLRSLAKAGQSLDDVITVFLDRRDQELEDLRRRYQNPQFIKELRRIAEETDRDGAWVSNEEVLAMLAERAEDERAA